ncbi:winged helix-turn-helix domain-containing protein [Catellatospora sp. KI3]|uniref:ArsR/SmtB family transcription factor n=1 Tax=Catellatospora sp. KI3 TaxID=3041620 RepID=UPI002482BF82|nr:winged helix-turn-helix domain-containing protein [Catellatospora sp. KI3]MDI1462260.1 winged helix-turn-helix domain-containing protein [Catellatospora sp. KI3]
MSLGDDLGPVEEPSLRAVTGGLRALAHPIRLRILSLLTGAAMSAAEVARELGITHANASYHLRLLLANGTITVGEEEQVRGGRAKRYRYDLDRDLTLHPDRPEPARDLEGSRLVYAALAAELQRRAQSMIATSGNFLADAELWVDPDDWREIRDRITAAGDDLHRRARRPHTPGTLHVSATIALFRMEEP